MEFGALKIRWKRTACLLAALAVLGATAGAAPLAHDETATSDGSNATSGTGDADTDTHASSAAATATSLNAMNSGTPSSNAAPGAGSKPSATAGTSAPTAVDISRSVKEVTKPLLEELVHSDVADAVRGLDTKADATADAALEADNDGARRDPTARRRAWDGSERTTAQTNSAAHDRDPQVEKQRASVLLAALIEDVKPWAIGAFALYVLGTMARFGLAMRRRTVQRRMERRRQQRRRSSSGHSQPPRS